MQLVNGAQFLNIAHLSFITVITVALAASVASIPTTVMISLTSIFESLQLT